MTQKILIILSLLATISCASFNTPLDSRLDSDKKKGLAVFSFTSQGVFNNFFYNIEAFQAILQEI